MTKRSDHPPVRGDPPKIPLLDTGVAGFNTILNGGLPALSCTLIAGGPGSGKTTLAMQFLLRGIA